MTVAKSMNDEVKSEQTNVLNLKSTLLLIIIQMSWSLGKHNLSLLKQFWVKMTLNRDKTRWVDFSKGCLSLSLEDHETTYVKAKSANTVTQTHTYISQSEASYSGQSEARKVSQTHLVTWLTSQHSEIHSRCPGSEFCPDQHLNLPIVHCLIADR